jgi:myosin heavy subunit
MPLPPNLLPALGYILAAIAGGFALYYWRRAGGFYDLLVEGANRFEELRQRGQQLESALAKAEARLKQHKETAQSLERAVDETRGQAAELAKKLEAKEHEVRYVAEKLELQKGHLEKQLAKAAEQLQTDGGARQETEARHSAALAETRQRASQRERELSDRLRDVNAKLESAEKRLAAETASRAVLEKRVSDADPVEMQRLKRKVAQFDRLYSSMKGLREMADERNRNWEVALRKLSAWIIKQRSGGRAGALPEAIGPLVGQALQVIGAQLIDDAEIMAAPRRDESETDESGDQHLDGVDNAESAAPAKDGLSHTMTLNQVDEVAKLLRS